MQRSVSVLATGTLLAAAFLFGHSDPFATRTASASPADPSRSSELNVVTDCGAVPDGSVDNRPVLQACIDRAGDSGSTLYFPPGTYNVAGTLAITAGGYTFRGANRETARIVETTSSANLFNAKTPTGSPLNHLTFSGLQLSYSSANATGTLLSCTDCWRTFLEDMGFGSTAAETHMGGTGVSTIGGNQFHIVNSTFSYPVGRAIYAAQIGDLYLSDLEINMMENSDEVGVVLDSNVGGIYATNVNVTAGKTGFLFQNTLGGPPPNYGFFTNCLADTQNGAGGIGWDFESAQSMVLTNSWAASATTVGVLANGVEGLTIDGGRIYNNGGVGIAIASGAHDVTIENSRIAGNSRLNNGAQAGVLLKSGANGVQLQNNRIGAQDTFANTQSYALEIQSGYGDTLQITGNDLLHNRTGEILNNAAGGARWVTSGNV